jgi:hypothetical protein
MAGNMWVLQYFFRKTEVVLLASRKGRVHKGPGFIPMEEEAFISLEAYPICDRIR